jgi:hypothetical protein
LAQEKVEKLFDEQCLVLFPFDYHLKGVCDANSDQTLRDGRREVRSLLPRLQEVPFIVRGAK